MLDLIVSTLTDVAIDIINLYKSFSFSLGGFSFSAFDAFLLFFVAYVLWTHFNGGSDAG